MKISRYAPLEHPWAHQFQRTVDSITAALVPDSARAYRCAARYLLTYLGENYPSVCSLNELRRHPHILGWYGLAAAGGPHRRGRWPRSGDIVAMTSKR